MSPDSSCSEAVNKETKSLAVILLPETLSDHNRIGETMEHGVWEQIFPLAELHHRLNSQLPWVLCNRKMVKVSSMSGRTLNPGNWNESICDEPEMRLSVTWVPQILSLHGVCPCVDKLDRSSRDNLVWGVGGE